MSPYCKNDQETCFTDLPLHIVLSAWLRRNISLPDSTETWLIQIGLFLLTWYTVKFALKIFTNFAWPVMIVVCGYVAIETLRMSGNQFPDNFLFYLYKFHYWATSTGLRILGYFCSTIGSEPLLYPPPF